MSDKAPAFQFYPKDFMGDARQAAMSLQEAGAYIRMMCLEWNEQGRGIPDHAVKCARMVGTTDVLMKRMWPTLRCCFQAHPQEPGMLIHPRLQKERDKQELYRRRQSDKGSQGAAKRWPKDSHGHAPAISPAMPVAIPEHSSSVSSLLSSTSGKKQEPSRPRGVPIFGRNEHLDHAACGPDLVWCVPSSVHRKFTEALAPKFAGDREAAKSALQEWYPTIWQALPADTVMGDAFKFWQPKFDEAFVSPQGPAASKLTSRIGQALSNFKASGE